MVFKCCVINCRTNYDTQTKKYPVFTFPSQPDLRNQWLEKIYTKSAKITNSSRVCVRHFNPEDIKRSNKHRTILLPNSVPVGSEHVIESESESEIEDVEEYNLEIVENESIIEEIGLTFEEFTTFVEEKQELVVENWNIYKHPSAFCFYKLSKYDEYLNDFSISFKIIVTSNMNVKICRGETEANSKELLWVLPETTLHSWDQFEDILNFYHQEPEIISKSQFLKHLTTAFKCLGQVKTDEVQDNIESLKVQLYSVLENAEQLEALMEADVKNEENVEKSVYVEALEEVPQQIIDDGTHYDEPMEGMEDIVVDAPQKSPKPEEVIHYKCQNCSLVFISDDNFKAHVINCGVLQESTSTISPVRKHQKKTHKENFDESLKSSKKFGVKREIKFYACSICLKNFKSAHIRREHEKTHQSNPELEAYLLIIDEKPRYACPKCAQHFEFSFILKKHIDGNCQTYEKKRKYRYPCPKCDKEFVTKIATAKHMSDVHMMEIGSIDKWCFECNSEFEDYVNHVRMHSCNFACSFCGAKFLTEERAMNHQLEKHANETEDDRRFKCLEEGCGLAFKSINHLRSHQLSLHTLQIRHFQCEQCAKSFSIKSLLNAHLRTHTRFGIFNCNFPECTRRFKKLTNLKEHAIRDHDEANIYLCNAEGCNNRYKMLNDLKLHCQESHKLVINIQKYFDNS